MTTNAEKTWIKNFTVTVRKQQRLSAMLFNEHNAVVRILVLTTALFQVSIDALCSLR